MALNKIAKMELEESKKIDSHVKNLQLQKHKLKYSHPYDKHLLRMGYDEILNITANNNCHNLVFVGAGAGDEAAYMRNRLPKGNRIIVTDLSYYNLKYHKEVFQNYSATLPNGVVACSFSELPFSKLSNKYCAVAFLCLHHSESIEQIVLHILDIFDQLVIFEPMTNRVLKFLSKFRVTQRKEHIDYRPSRISRSFIDKLKNNFEVETKTFFQMPRDYLPFISHKQHEIFIDEMIRVEVIWSNILFNIQNFINHIFTQVKFGNMALVHIRRRV